jgi:hypothetical protein
MGPIICMLRENEDPSLELSDGPLWLDL